MSGQDDQATRADGGPATESREVELRLPGPGEVASAIPGLARIAASTAMNATQWGLLTSARTARRMLRVAQDPAEAQRLAHELGVTVGLVRRMAGAVAAGEPWPDVVERFGPDDPPPDSAAGPARRPRAAEPREERPAASLRDRGAELLARSRDVWDTQDQHPAYERILGDLAPDEARVLVLLTESGPQPSVDVRTGGPIGTVSSQLIAPGLSMIGARAGCRHLDRVPSYLNNLHRLGLVWFSREQVSDPREYQVLEAQPDVLEALKSQRFTKAIRRSIHLTPFGSDFVRATLIDSEEEFPEHGLPSEAGE